MYSYVRTIKYVGPLDKILRTLQKSSVPPGGDPFKVGDLEIIEISATGPFEINTTEDESINGNQV